MYSAFRGLTKIKGFFCSIFFVFLTIYSSSVMVSTFSGFIVIYIVVWLLFFYSFICDRLNATFFSKGFQSKAFPSRKSIESLVCLQTVTSNIISKSLGSTSLAVLPAIVTVPTSSNYTPTFKSCRPNTRRNRRVRNRESF